VVSSTSSGKQEVASAASCCSATHLLGEKTGKKKEKIFAKSPFGFGGFSGKYKTTLVFADLRFQQVQKVVKSIRDFLLINKAQLVFTLIFSNS
jgi:hypothetical protein